MRRLVFVVAAWAALRVASAAEFTLGDDQAVMFGQVERMVSKFEDTLPDLARRHSLGYEEILRANPGVDPWLPGAGKEIVLPGQRILPPGPRSGIVINLPEHRLYFYPKAKKGEPQRVITFPVSIGKMDWNTPLGQTKIVNKRKNPSWYPPESVRKEHAERGEPLPKVVAAGPDNPLGAFAMRLGIPNGAYLIHGTNNPLAVGMAITHGCIRMYPEDIAALFPLVKVGTTVWLINEPVKVARIDGDVWLEAHPPIDANGQSVEPDLAAFTALVDQALGESDAAIHWEVVQTALSKASGLPAVVGLELLPLASAADDAAAPDAAAAAQ
jgi:L,D-transpeptidase ErfK/SrfK